MDAKKIKKNSENRCFSMNMVYFDDNDSLKSSYRMKQEVCKNILLHFHKLKPLRELIFVFIMIKKGLLALKN